MVSSVCVVSSVCSVQCVVSLKQLTQCSISPNSSPTTAMSSEVLYSNKPFSTRVYYSQPLTKGVHLSQLQARLSSPVVTCSWPKSSTEYSKSLGTNALLEAVHLAYTHRLPLTLSPDMIWSCIQQGVGVHVRVSHKQIVNTRLTNPEVWKERVYVEEEGSSWDETVANLSMTASERIRERFKHNLLPCFSTSGNLQQLCMRTALGNPLNTAKKCLFAVGRDGGIVEIALEGTPDDWTTLHDRTIQLLKDIHYDIDWWIDTVLPILDQFISASTGTIDHAFWSRMYKTVRSTNGEDPFIHGWINVLFPYLETTDGEYIVNDWPYKMSEQKLWEAPVSMQFPSGLTAVPFTTSEGATGGRQYTVVSGFVGVSRDRHTRGVRPRLGWAVVEETFHPVATTKTSAHMIHEESSV